ncbi:MAG: PP2C family protein-serine/threonine phosphatase [Anaerolineae bacterium]|jgi:serine phosphatase RsbU (regulator of sigma subunit)
MNTELLRRLPLLAGLTEDDLALLHEGASSVAYAPGALLLHEGERDDRVLVVASGQVEIVKALGSADERVLALCGPGDLLGEMSLFTAEGVHTASARASAPTTVVALRRAALDGLLQRRPLLAYGLMRQLSRRLDTGEHLTIRDLREKNRALMQALHDLEAAQAQLVEKERLEHEVALARRIQQSMLPELLPSEPGYDLGALMTPARQVGGDFYDAVRLDEGRIALAVGDVCDKGFGAAFFMAQCFGLLRAEATRRRAPGATLRALNRHLLGMNRSSQYVTLLYVVLDAATGRLHYARAGHPPLLLAAPGDGWRCAPTRTGQMLGLFAEPLLDEGVVELPPGEVALLYSDGLTEATDEAGVEGGSERIGRLAASAGQSGAQALCEALWQALQAPASQEGVHDDFTVVALRRWRR